MRMHVQIVRAEGAYRKYERERRIALKATHMFSLSLLKYPTPALRKSFFFQPKHGFSFLTSVFSLKNALSEYIQIPWKISLLHGFITVFV